IFIEVPGLYTVPGVFLGDLQLYLQNAHLYHFSLGSLSNALQAHGLRLQDGDEHIRSLWSIASPQKDFANRYAETKDFLRRLEEDFSRPTKAFKRRLLKGAMAVGLVSGLYERGIQLWHRLAYR